MKKALLLFHFISFAMFFCQAQTWTGSSSTDWNNGGNWSPTGVPSSSSSITIPAGLVNYPKLTSSVVVSIINMQPGSRLDFNGFSLGITSVASNYNYIDGATLLNSSASTDIVINLNTGNTSYTSYIRNSTFNDNVIVNLTGTNNFIEGDGSSPNIYNGSATFNVNASLPVTLSQSVPSTFNSHVSIVRTVAGTSNIFNTGANISGNFSYTSNVSGSTTLGTQSARTAINGMVNISANYNGTPDFFNLYKLVNQTSGGTVSIVGSRGFSVINDTLKVASFSINRLPKVDFP